MNIDRIKDLEKKYMDKIWNVVRSSNFIDDLKKIETYIKENYNYLYEYWDEKNKLKIGAERLIRFHFYKNLNIINIYPSPISSDMSIELEDVLLNIDAKTIDMIGNPGDDKSIHFQKNQITFDNNPFFKRKINTYNFSGVTFPSRLEAFYNKKPVLTFFVTINYYDNNKDFFMLSHLSVCCIPHKNIVQNDFENDIISNFKTYEYINSERANTFQNPNLYKPKIDKKDYWIPFNIKNCKKDTSEPDAYLDPKLDHPIIQGGKVVWKKIDKKFKILTFGGSARIDKTKIEKRKDSQYNEWAGVKKIEIYSKEKIDKFLKIKKINIKKKEVENDE